METNISNETEFENKSYSIGKKILGGIGVSLLLLIMYLGIQAVISSVSSIVMSAQLTVQNPGASTEEIQMLLMEKFQNSGIMTVLLAVATAISAGVVAIWYYLAHGRKKESTLKITGAGFATIVFLTVGVYYVACSLQLISQELFTTQGENLSQMMTMALGGNIVLALLSTVCLAPIGEECLLRGLVLKRLEKYQFSMVAIIIIQAVLFGLLHLNLIQGIYAFFIGLVYGYVAYKTKSVLPSIFMHMINNALPNLFRILPESCFSIWFTTVVGIVFLIVAFIINKRRKTN